MANLLYQASDTSRFVSENSPVEEWRDEFRRDFARVIHCPSFRRLQGKTQLFPGHESDFFRNRLTHSLEVGQVAESIAHSVNGKPGFFENNPINPRICLTASLLHDIGHPPFGHNGEEALDEAMRPFGGFEGNAQTLRIVSQLEKKRYNPADSCPVNRRAGLNLTYRTLGAILKYDSPISQDRQQDDRVRKGYYFEDAPIVSDIKKAVCQNFEESYKFKTIECSIMDIADDIAYSTYDLEDSFKAGFLTPSKILSSDVDILEKVAKKVGKTIGQSDFSAKDVLAVFLDLFSGWVTMPTDISPKEQDSKEEVILSALAVGSEMDAIATDGHVRTQFTSDLVGRFINGVSVELNEKYPQLSSIKVDREILIMIETLKNYSFESTIYSSKIKISEYRGKDVVTGLFDALTGEKGHLLLPDDTLKLVSASSGNEQRIKRIICDFIAGMTDRYAIEFYGRLYSEGGQSMFKPL